MYEVSRHWLIINLLIHVDRLLLIARSEGERP